MDYKDKLRLAKEALDSGSYDKETIEYIFPELAESEDERIRTTLICELSKIKGGWQNGLKVDDVLAWLKKQCKTSPVLSNSSNIGKFEPQPTKDRYMEGYLNGINDASKTQKSDAWSEEDEKQLNDIIRLLPELDIRHNWLKSLKDRVQPQNTWKPSEEMLEALYKAIPEDVMEKSEDEMLLDKLYQGLKYGRVLSDK